MPVSGLAVEVFLAEAVPNLSASQSSLTANTNITNTPGATGLLTPAQSPSGSVTGQASTWEFANTELAVQFQTARLVAAQNDGVAFDQTDPPTPTAPGYTTTETTPAAPSGTYKTYGTAYISRATLIAAGCVSNPVNLG